MGDFTLVEERTAKASQVLPLIYEGISEMWQDQVSTTPYLTQMVRPSDRVVYARSSEGDAVGVICFRVEGPEARVGLLYVEPSSRRLGLGSLLWERMLEIVGAEGALTVRVEVDSTNDAGKGLAEHVGAEDVVIVFEQDVPVSGR
ncbi:acetyltransferase [Rhodobacter phage RcZahn]|nr:acetyltransferase [Rhodobacter phage RcZahn]